MGITVDDIGVYVVNLRRRPDRRRRIARYVSGWSPRFTSDWDSPRIDGRDIDREYLDQAGYGLFDWQIESDNEWWARPLKTGEIGCALAHLACWENALSRDVSYAVVLEDDAVPVCGFSDRLMAGLNTLDRMGAFDVLYLGRFPLEPDTPAQPGFVVPGYSHCTFGYVLSRSGLKIALDADLGSAIVPVDEFLPSLYTDHPRADLRERFPRRMAALAFDPPLVTQLPKAVAGSDTEDSDFVWW